MPEIVPVANKRGFHRIRASPRFSVSLLEIDLERDALSLLLDLLNGICTDYSEIPKIPTAPAAYVRRESSGVSPFHLLIARLNVLVLLSKRIFLVLEEQECLRLSVLRAVYHVIRLTIWCTNRSVRCAALRCLRYYIHTPADVELFLECRLDLLVARCLDLSYMNCPSSYSMKNRTSFQKLEYPHLMGSHPVVDSPTGPTDPTLPVNRSGGAVGSNQVLTNQPYLRVQKPFNPRRRLMRGSGSPPVSTNRSMFDESNSSAAGHLYSSPLVSTMGERQMFLRLAYHLVQISPQLFPSSLVQAVAAPCLRVGRFLNGATSGSDAKKEGQPMYLGLGNRQADRMLNTRGERPDNDDSDSMLKDIALRSCLLILVELIILAPMRVLHPDLAGSSFRDPSARPSDQVRNSSHLERTGKHIAYTQFNPSCRVTVEALISTFASSPQNTTNHPPRIHEAVLLALLTTLNKPQTACLFPLAQVAKFLVPFTSVRGRPYQPKSLYNTYLSFSECAKNCLIGMLRSWSGLFYFLHDGLPCLQTLMYSLAVGSTEMRDQILDLLFGLFPALPTPHPSTQDMEPAIFGLIEALASCAPSALPVLNSWNPCATATYSETAETGTVQGSAQSSAQSSCPNPQKTLILPRRRCPRSAWDLEGGFVAGEGCRIFSRCGPRVDGTIDLMESYTALLLTVLVQAGLYEGLIRAISDTSHTTSVRAGLLLGYLVHKAYRLLPQNHPATKRLQQAEMLSVKATGSHLAVIWLARVHRIMHAHDTRLADPCSLVRIPLHSPFLECLARQSSTRKCSSSSSSAASGNATTESFNLESPTSFGGMWLDQMIAQSGVVPPAPVKNPVLSGRSTHHPPSENQQPKPPELWDWELLASFGRYLFDQRSLLSWEDQTRSRFLRRIMDFLTPGVEVTMDVGGRHTSSAHPSTTRSSSIPSVDFFSSPSTIHLRPHSNFSVVTDGGHAIRSAGSRTFSSLATVTGSTMIPSQLDPLRLNGQQLNTSSISGLDLAQLPHTWTHAPAAGILAAGLIPHLAAYPPGSEPNRLLTKFLVTIREALKTSMATSSVSNAGPFDTDPNSSTSLSSLFDFTHLCGTCSTLLLLAVGRLTSSEAGEARLESSGLCAVLHNLLLHKSLARERELTRQLEKRRFTLAKVLLSSLDLTHPGRLGHQFLKAAISGGSKATKLYAIQLIRLLFRLRLPFLVTWCIDMVIKLTLDPSREVVRQAFYLLEETCWDPVNVHAIARHILPKPRSVVTKEVDEPAQTLTPFAIRLLDPRTGPIGHRIFSRVLSRSNAFERLVGTRPARRMVNTEKSADGTLTRSNSLPLSELSPVDRHPVDWMLDVARKHFNFAYAAEVDARLSVLFTGCKIQPDHVVAQPSERNALHDRFSQLAFLYGQSPDALQRLREVSKKSSVTDENDDSDCSSDQWYPSNQDFNFDEAPSLNGASFAGAYLPPALVSDNHSSWIAQNIGDVHCLLLPQHPYGCLAEHKEGIDLLKERGDLCAAVHVLESAKAEYLTCANHTVRNSQDLRLPETTIFPTPSVMEVKSSLWALAAVGSARCGQSWIASQPDLIHLFKSFAVCADSTGLRATAWLCLNLLASRPANHVLLSDTYPDIRSPPRKDLVSAADYQTASQITWLVSGSDFYSFLQLPSNTTGLPNESGTVIRTKKNATEPRPNSTLSYQSKHFEVVPIDRRETDSLDVICDRAISTASVEKRGGRGIWRIFSRNNSSRASNIIRRWFPSRLSPRPKGNSPRTTDTDGLEKIPIRIPSNCVQPSPSTVALDKCEDRVSVPPNSPLSSNEKESSEEPLGATHPSTRFLSATWTHQDMLNSRKLLMKLSDGSSGFVPDRCRVSSASLIEQGIYPLDRKDRLICKGICLPSDVRVLGRRYVPGSSNLRSNSVRNNASQSIGCEAGSGQPVQSLSSFVHVAANAEAVLSRCLSPVRPCSHSVLPGSNEPVGGHCDLGRSSRSVNGDLEINGYAELNSHEVEVHSSNHLDVVPTSTIGVPDENSVSSSPRPVNHIVQHEQKKALKHHEASGSACLNGSENHRVDIQNCVKQESQDRKRTGSFSVVPNGCLSLVCRNSSSESHSNQIKGNSSEQALWRSQLLDIVSGLLSNVFSAAHEQALNRLIRSAFISQRDSMLGPYATSKMRDTHHLFDACIYSDVAHLLSTYSFPLEVRTTIQSAFLGLEISELLSDAVQMVDELTQFLLMRQQNCDIVSSPQRT
ncbi:unnamed protein product [Calicophoron daubneyi]|uniref:Rapamycin-insensitive companion of mTOR n=1 Tax=Calicophoron daubneyi TaxID=300641 RepID=A0AAV2T7T4_CALDB